VPRGTGLVQMLLEKRHTLEHQIAQIDGVLRMVKGHKRMGPKPGFKRNKRQPEDQVTQPVASRSRQPRKNRKPMGVRTRPKEHAVAAAAELEI
jgi:hypothetical protein